MKTSNRKSREFVQDRKEFKASYLSARNEGHVYVVYSYGWYPLLVYHYASDRWFENSEKYSSSTSRQLSQCHPKVETLRVSHAGLKDLINMR